MRRPDDGGPLPSTVLQAEIVEAMADTVTDVVARLSPGARLRLLAFLHLLDHPENASATFDLSEAGLMRLTLACPVGQEPSKIN